MDQQANQLKFSRVLTEEGNSTVVGIRVASTEGPDGDVELSDQDQDDEDETSPGSVDTEHGSEGKLPNIVTLSLPCSSESNVAQTNTAPGEQGRETGKSQEPVEDVTAARADVDVGDRAKDQDGDNGPQRPTRLVNVGEDSRSESGFSHGGQGSGTGVDAGETDRQDGDTDGGVDEVVETLNTGSLEDEDEGRGGGIVAAASEESVIGVGNKQTDDGQRGDVDDRDSPEGLLD